MWKTNLIKKPKLNKPILVEGLPGVGNVAKIAADFLADQVKAELCATFTGPQLSHAVFVQEDNMVGPPVIELYYKKRPKKNDLLFLLGDIQPFDEESALALGQAVLRVFGKLGGSSIVTLGGIVSEQPENKKVYCTGTKKKLVNDWTKQPGVSNHLYGVVGPIVGITGVLLSLANQKRIPAISLLAETSVHPTSLGVVGGKQLIDVLSKKLRLTVNTELLAETFALPVVTLKAAEDPRYIG